MTENELSIKRGSLGLIVFGLMACLIGGCSDAPRTSDPVMGAIVYVDLETQLPVVQLATNDIPAVHPETGERTLMPGLYCPKCQRWHPAPAFDKLQHIPGAAVCPADGTPMTTDGPWPQGVTQ